MILKKLSIFSVMPPPSSSPLTSYLETYIRTGEPARRTSSRTVSLVTVIATVIGAIAHLPRTNTVRVVALTLACGAGASRAAHLVRSVLALGLSVTAPMEWHAALLWHATPELPGRAVGGARLAALVEQVRGGTGARVVLPTCRDE